MKKLDKRTIITLAVVAVLMPLLMISGGGESYSGVRIGYVSSKSRTHWSASYAKLDGTMQKSLYPETEDYLLTMVTNDGTIGLTMTAEDGEIYFSQTDIPTGEYPVTLKGTTRVKIHADGHRGSFSLEPLE